MHEICDISTPLWILPFSTSEKSCFTEIIVAKLSFRILNFLTPIPTKLLYFYIIWPLEFFGVEGITLGDPGLTFFVLLSRNMPDYGTIV